MIQLASGNMKRVELLRTEDFVNSAASCPDISLEEATVTKLDSNNSYRTKLEYEVNFLKEKLRRIENGVEVPVSAPVYQPEPTLDENEMFLRFLDADTSEIIRDLQIMSFNSHTTR